jgi:hypothetical protein
MKNTILILTAAVSLIIIEYAKAQDLKADRTQFQWNGWDVQLEDMFFTDTIKTAFGRETADDNSEFVYCKFTVTNSSHEGRIFSPQNNLKIVIGDNNFDAADVGGWEYTDNIEPTLSRARECYFELPKALVKDSFVIRFNASFVQSVNVTVSVSEAPAPTSTPATVAAPVTETPDWVMQDVENENSATEVDKSAQDDWIRAWNALTPAQRSRLHAVELSWSRYKDTLAIPARNREIRRNTAWLRSLP